MSIQMSVKKHKREVFIIALIATFLLVTFLISFMGARCELPNNGSPDIVRCGHPVTNWLYDFQALIAGIFALIGAAITVYMMHLNSIEIGNSEWRVKISNMISIVRQLETVLDQLEEEKQRFFNKRSSFTVRDYSEFFYTLLKMTKHIKYILQAADDVNLSFYAACFIRPNIDTADYLAGQLKVQYKDLTHYTEVTESLTQQYARYANSYFYAIKEVNDQTLAAFKMVLQNQHAHNPLNLKEMLDH